MASYSLVLLQDGYGFTPQDTITSVDKVNGFTTGWALGAVLHEINNLPWELDYAAPRSPWGKYILCLLIGAIVGLLAALRIGSDLTESPTAEGRYAVKSLYGVGAGAGAGAGNNPLNALIGNGTNLARSRSSSGGTSSPNTGKESNIQMVSSSSRAEGDDKQATSSSVGAKGWTDRISQLNPFASSISGYEPITDEKDSIKA
jgi:hypothetical protein